MQFSVLMSIYEKENPAYFSECIKSLAQQTLQPDEIVLIEDGKLTDELERVVSEFQNLWPQLTVYRYEENRGLGKALADGLLKCSYPLVARMDTDDVAFPDRFERQVKAFEEDRISFA